MTFVPGCLVQIGSEYEQKKKKKKSSPTLMWLICCKWVEIGLITVAFLLRGCACVCFALTLSGNVWCTVTVCGSFVEGPLLYYILCNSDARVLCLLSRPLSLAPGRWEWRRPSTGDRLWQSVITVCAVRKKKYCSTSTTNGKKCLIWIWMRWIHNIQVCVIFRYSTIACTPHRICHVT